MNETLTLTGESALTVKYAIELVRIKFTEFAGLSDDEVLAYLIERGFDASMEVVA